MKRVKNYQLNIKALLNMSYPFSIRYLNNTFERLKFIK